jgi:mono/diheme cytochrome c family protein
VRWLVKRRSPRSRFREGVFTKEQATRGEELFVNTCAACHGEALLGLEMAPALAGSEFNATWDGQPLSALVDRMKTMPPDKPGSLPRAQTVAILSYILSYNGLPAGKTPLSDDATTLSMITYQAPQ